MRVALLLFLSLSLSNAIGQNVEAFGFFGGFNFPITIDEGLNNDPRYFGRFTFRGTPVGLSYGYDHVGFGYVFTPQYLQIGQNFTIKNSIGGEIGSRDIKMDYFSLPISLKLHINDLAFFRLSAVASVNFNYLLNGSETITHIASKVKYPAGVSIPLDPNYTVVYDGIFVPQVDNLEYVSNDKFNAFQIFAALGLRSDFDLNDDWSINFDGRANFGIFDTRQSSYIDQLKSPTGDPDLNGNLGATDLYGQRREMYISINFGLARIITSKNKFKTKKTGITNRSGGGTTGKPKSKKPKT
jgi:Outer membrane protein beta-barrel domain